MGKTKKSECGKLTKKPKERCGKLTFAPSLFMHLHTLVRIVTSVGKEKQNENIKIKKIIIINRKEPRRFC